MGRNLYTKNDGWFGDDRFKRDRKAERKVRGGSIFPGGPLVKALIALAVIIVIVKILSDLVLAAHP